MNAGAGYTPYDDVEGVANSSNVFTDTLVVKDSVLTSGAYRDLGTSAFENAMQTTATFDNATITDDILFASTFDNNFYVNSDPATDTTDDGVYNPTTNGWDGTDKLDGGGRRCLPEWIIHGNAERWL